MYIKVTAGLPHRRARAFVIVCKQEGADVLITGPQPDGSYYIAVDQPVVLGFIRGFLVEQNATFELMRTLPGGKTLKKKSKADSQPQTDIIDDVLDLVNRIRKSLIKP